MFINCPAIELTSSIVDDIVVVYEELHKEEPFIYIAYLIKLRQKNIRYGNIKPWTLYGFFFFFYKKETCINQQN